MIEKLKNLEATFSLTRAAALVGGFALLSRVAGLVRDMTLSSQFGAGELLDIYNAAFRLPDLLFNFLVLGTLSAAFIPIFTQKLNENKQEAMKLAGGILNISLLVISIASIFCFLFAEPITKLLVPGFSGEKLESTIKLTRLFLLSPLLFTLSNVFTSILHSLKRFFVVSFAPVFYNLGIIFGIFFLYPRFGLMGLGIGVVLGAAIHCAIQAVAAFISGFRPSAGLPFSDPAVKRIGRLFLPRILGIDMSSFSLVISTIIGSALPSGSISAFNLANNLQTVPLGLFAFSTAVAAFPLLSEQAAKQKAGEFIKTFYSSAIQVLFFIFPISALIILHREYIVRLAFGYGKFDWVDTVTTFSVLGGLSISLFSQSLAPLLSRGFYSLQNTLTPVLINLASLVLNTGLAIFLSGYTADSGEKLGIVGVAWAFSFSSILNAFILYSFFKKYLVKFFDLAQVKLQNIEKEAYKKILRLALATCGSSLISIMVQYFAGSFIGTETVLELVLLSIVVFGSGLSAYLGITNYWGFRESRKLLHIIKFW